ncbi:MAG TPA: DUF2127 domain-containing protein [Thermoanaerobaculia bacterium]
MHDERSGRVLRLIAFFRFAKAFLLILSAVGALRLLKAGALAHVVDWLSQVAWASQHEVTRRAIAMITRMPPKRIEQLAIAALLYAALFITEGTGLWLGKLWAEWLTVVATASFTPFEAYEVIRRPRPVSATVLVLNIVIVVYLVWRIWSGRRRLK